jgi:hypothetical protein
LHHRRRESVQEVRQRPSDEDHAEPGARTQPIHHHAHGDLAERHPEQKAKENPAVIRVGELELVPEHRRHQRQYLPVENVDLHREEQQQQNRPPDAVIGCGNGGRNAR